MVEEEIITQRGSGRSSCGKTDLGALHRTTKSSVDMRRSVMCGRGRRYLLFGHES